MAVVNYSVETLVTWRDRASVITWTGLATGDTGQPLEMTGWADRSIQATGTFGGATVNIEGSNNGTNWSLLTDPQGNNIALTSAKIEQVMEITRFIRPAVSGGSGVSINIITLVRR
jgi:hypothetical protein